MTQPATLHSEKGFNSHNIYKEKGSRQFQVSLKQWRMLHAVVDCGSFANAAEYLHVTQPAISYAIAKLEDQLGLSVLKLEGRKAHITEKGKILLDKSRFLVREAIELEEFAQELKQNDGPEVHLAVGKDFPKQILISALRIFSLCPRNVKVRLIQESTQEIDRVLVGCNVDLALNLHVPDGFDSDLLLEMEYVPVAHPEHALFRLNRQITEEDLGREVQVVSNMEIAASVNRRFARSQSAQCWNVSGFDTAESVLSEGMGFGWLPKDHVQRALKEGTLRVLQLKNAPTFSVNFYLIHGRVSLRCAEAKRLAAIIRSVAAKRVLIAEAE